MKPRWSALALLACFALGIVLLAPPSARAEPVRRTVVNRIVAVAGSDVITLVELRRRARPYLAQLTNADEVSRLVAEEKVYKEVVQRIIEERLIDSHARSLSIATEAAEIDRGLAALARAQGQTPQALLAAAASIGLSEADCREALRLEILTGKLVQIRLGRKKKGPDASSPGEMDRAIEQERRALLDELRRDVFIEVWL
jgi:peptidyl-prolyl cis-trans isomerase SurA